MADIYWILIIGAFAILVIFVSLICMMVSEHRWEQKYIANLPDSDRIQYLQYREMRRIRKHFWFFH